MRPWIVINGILAIAHWTACQTVISASTDEATTEQTTVVESSDTGFVSLPTHKHRLRAKLLDKYDKLVHPVLNNSDVVKVDMGMALIHLSLDELSGIMSVDAWMRLNWTDEHLTWDPKDYGGVEKVHFGVNELWRPDILLYNSADDARFDPYGKTHFLVEHTGAVLWVPPAHLKGYCKLRLRYWPMDSQFCKLKFGSWTSHGQEIDLGLYRGMQEVEILNFYSNNREWKISDTEVKARHVKYPCCSETYPDITFEFTLARNSPTYKSILILPCLVIMLMTVCCFLLPPTAGEKVIINGFAFVSTVMFLIYFACTVPFYSDETPIIVQFFSNTTALIGIGLLLNVTCLSMCRERKYSRPPKLLRVLFSGTLGRFLCLGHYYHQVSPTHQRLNVELTDMAESEQQTEDVEAEETTTSSNGRIAREDVATVFNHEQSDIMNEWILVAAGIERIFFIIYSLAFAVVTSVYA